MLEKKISDSKSNFFKKKTFPDMSVLVSRCHHYMEKEKKTNEIILQKKDINNLLLKDRHKPEVLLKKDVALELGHPSTASFASVLSCIENSNIRDRCLTIIGPDMKEMLPGQSYPFAQFLFISFKENSNFDPFTLENTQYLNNRISGYAVRSLPGRLWARIAKKELSEGFNFQNIALALNKVYKTEFKDIEALEIVFITESLETVQHFSRIEKEMKIISGEYKKISFNSFDDLECSELSCNGCEEEEICSDLRDVIQIKRKQRNS